jgi:hypothetical protein
MKKILMTLVVMALTAFSAFGQSNWAKTVMYDSQTGRFLDPKVVSSNQLVVSGAQNTFTGTQTFYAVTLGGVTQTNWPSGGGDVYLASNNIFTGLTNTFDTQVYVPKIVATNVVTQIYRTRTDGQLQISSYANSAIAPRMILYGPVLGDANYNARLSLTMGSSVLAEYKGFTLENEYGVVLGVGTNGNANLYGHIWTNGVFYGTFNGNLNNGNNSITTNANGFVCNTNFSIGGNNVLTNYTETDPVWVAASNQYATTNWVALQGYLTTIPSYYVTNGMSANFATLSMAVFSNASSSPVPVWLGSAKIWDWAWNAVYPKVPVFANDGSAVAPAYAFDYDHSVGMYRYGAGVLGFSALETNTFRIDSTGVTVIGSLTLGGVGMTNWPSAGGDVYLASNNTFVGANTFISTITATNDGRSVWGEGLDISSIHSAARGAIQRGWVVGGTHTIGNSSAGSEQAGYYEGTNTIGSSVYGGSQRGYNGGLMQMGNGSAGSDQSGYNTGTMIMDVNSVGSVQRGYNLGGVVTNSGARGTVQLFLLTSGQTSKVSNVAHASIVLGAGSSSNQNSIVAGDGQVSHGDGSITAGGGFWDNGVRLTSGGGGVTFPDGSYMTNVWVGSTNTLYIVDPTKVYTNKIGQFGP